MALSAKKRNQLLKLIVVKYVPESVRLDYRKISSDAAELLLDALFSTISSLHLELVFDAKGFGPEKKKHANDFDCPIVELLSSQTQGKIRIIKQRVSSWRDTLKSQLLSNPFALSMREMQLERAYEEMKEAEADGNNDQIEICRSTVLGTKIKVANFEWKDLSQIDIKDLRLFEVCKGSVLRGTLVASPAVMTGITTFLRDGTGAIVQICLYNFVPGKMNRLDKTTYARKHLSIGTRVEIAEPFSKIFFDGNRGVRIGNVRALLGNWSQVSLELKFYHESLATAAASLRIWTDDKAIYRLCKALALLNEANLAMSILRCYNGATFGLRELKSSISYYINVMANDDNSRTVMASPPKIFPDWASHHIETFSDPFKGRGIRARNSLARHCLILIESPLSVAKLYA